MRLEPPIIFQAFLVDCWDARKAADEQFIEMTPSLTMFSSLVILFRPAALS
jgi:hypothetical protein